ncbi:MAG: hypothetical protein QHH18_07665 [Candidatus Bathyarchaeota archaeon]|jgi:hypothetical protein|nr:hypothetical protein [Candidatus Bathyarchaeota archaeon A05DMB-5]MDH7558457.1 hypothetical protein [Candidatus Bathyarchaeota archaeon]
MQRQEISNKIKVTMVSQKFEGCPEKDIKFYRKYAAVAFKTLTNPLFQRFINWIILKENINEHMITTIQIRAFPFRKQNGNGLAGKFNKKGKIVIYPKRLEFCKKLMQETEKENVYCYIKARARATLIHELLHVKYSNDEDKVRQLTRKYIRIFTRHRNSQDSNAKHILRTLFSH